jgi:BMFP domain-containing protein YqiC
METIACQDISAGVAPTWCTMDRPRPVLVSKRRIAASRVHSALVFWASLRYQAAMSDKSIEDLARKLAESLPEGLRAVRDDLESNFHAVLKAGLARLDLVTREEFEVQESILARTREKLVALEKRLEELEDE